MKKQYFFALGLMMAGLTASAQTNLVLNGDFENWTEANPVNFSENTFGSNTYNDNIAKETSSSLIHGGANSVKQTSQSSTGYLEYNNLVDVIAGHSYTLSYWYLDNDNKARTRPWSTWLDSTNNAGGAHAEPTDAQGNAANPHVVQTLQEEDYSTDGSNWVFKSITKTAPEWAVKVRVQLRTYRQSTNASGGFIYYDDLSFVDNSVQGVNEHAIAAVKMFPNPLNGNVLTVLTESDAPKTVAIYDLLGKEVLNAATDNNNTINTGVLTAGVYMVKISQEGKTATRKLVVQ